MPARAVVAPLRELAHAGFEHLVGVEARILAQQGPARASLRRPAPGAQA